MLYRLQDNITNLKVSGYVLGTSLRETSNDIVGRSRLLWRLIGGVTLAASAVIVFLAFSSSAYFTRATRDRESLLRTLMETISDFIWLKDPKGVYLFCNPKFERFFGAKEADIVGKTDYDFLESDLADFFREKDRAVMAAGEHRVNEEEIVYAVDGRRELIETIKTPMYDSEGGLIGVLGVARDITDRKRAEAQLNQARTYISNIIDSMPSVLVGVDAEGRVTQWNSKAEKAMGLSAVQAVGQPLVQVAPRLSREMARVREAVQSRRPQAVSKRPRPRGGETRYEDVTVYPLIANGVEGAVIRVDDVTEKVRMEEMMIQSEKMLSVGGLAAGMAHEINNPLAGMMQTTTVLSDRLTGDLSANTRAAEE
ncbi:MAG: PAS domain S-box protein, partial [Desulfobacterales bacterium]|nr:PAS domain S-box protein [Desulfobacterales bacterium]